MTTEPTSENPARPGIRWLPWLLGCGVLLVLLVVGVVVVGAYLLSGFDDAGERVSTAQIEDVGRIRLPPSARAVHAHLEGFQDRFIQVRFEMAPSDLASFEAALHCRLGPPSSQPPALTPAEPAAWWTPEAGHSWRTCEGDGGWFHQSVSVEVSDPSRAVVHLVVFEH